MGTILLVLSGIWALRHIPLDALPDISDVEVIIHTPWAGQPPSIIEDQVTYPIVTTLLAAPHVKAVRAQTMFGDSYVFVVFEDTTDLYWARSRVLEYMQQITGRLPAGVHPVIGPDATGAGWVYEYALVDHSHQRSLADLRSIQDWYLRYQLETVPGVAEVATIGGFVRQYQVNLDPDKLRAYGISLSTVIERVRASTNEVGGRLLEMGGAEYMIRGLGYLRSLNDLETVPVATKNGTPVLVRDLGTVTFGPDIREGVAEWQGEGETVGGIVVMRDGMNALTVIDGVKKKLAEIKLSLPPGVEMVAGYDRSGLIHASIDPCDLEHHVARRFGARDWRPRGRCYSHGRKWVSAAFRAAILRIRISSRTTETKNPVGFSETSRSRNFLFPGDHRGFLPACLLIGSTGRAYVPPPWVDEDAGRWLLLRLGYHASARTHDPIHPRTADT